MSSIEIFLNFPIMDINRSVLHAKVKDSKLREMTRFWGDDSWRNAAYRTERGLFETQEVKVENWELVKAFQERLRTVAGFKFAAEPMAMRNTRRSTVYYLISPVRIRRVRGSSTRFFETTARRDTGRNGDAFGAETRSRASSQCRLIRQ